MKTHLEELMEELENLKIIARNSGWIERKHIFKFLEEIQMFQYDVIQRKINKIENCDTILKDVEEKIERHRKRKHPALKWCEKCKDFEEIKQLIRKGIK